MINFNILGELLCEEINYEDRSNLNLIRSKDDASINNKFDTNAKGIIISDSYNNPFMPIRPMPRLDTSKFELPLIFRRCRELYSQEYLKILPWHFCIEMIDDRYYIFNTRPLDMKFPLNNDDVINSPFKETWAEDTIEFFKDPIINISECVHILILGDTTFDVYPRVVYELIGRTCIVPTTRREKLPGLNQRIFSMNLGQHFKLNLITKFIRK